MRSKECVPVSVEGSLIDCTGHVVAGQVLLQLLWPALPAAS